MINIKLWKNNNLTHEKELVKLLKKSFNINKKEELNLVKNKTYIVSIIINSVILGTVSLISNNDLISYLKTKSKNIEPIIGTYSFKASPGVYIYNLSVNEKFRNKGLAQKLVDIAIYIARQKKFNYCHTHCENETSQYIFKKNKFNVENVFNNEKNKTVKLMTSWL
jgi:ribosomal protein S18 acetylase RimI-like enzyme